MSTDREGERPRPPDAFFPGVPRGIRGGPVYLALGIIGALSVPASGLAIWAARTGRLKNAQRPHTPGR